MPSARNRRATSPPGFPSGEPRGANIAGIAASYVKAVVATSLAAAASGSPTVFTCKAEDQLEGQTDAVWGVPVSSVMAVLALMALSAAIGRWSAPRSPGKELAQDLEPWVVVSEITATPQPMQDDKERPAAREEPVGVAREGSQVPRTPPHSGNGRPPARVEPPGVREVASQAPCTYTVVRRCARGRFQPLPDTAHG